MTDEIQTDKIITLDLKQFKDKLSNFDKNSISNGLIKKKIELLNDYSCFKIDKKDFYKEKKVFKEYNSHEDTQCYQRVHLITGNFTEESSVKKQFTSFLNKLSDNNKNIILPKLKHFIETIEKKYIKQMYEILWTFIKHSYSQLYIDIIDFFDEELLIEYTNDYIENKKWFPEDAFINNELLNNDDDIYDIYCEYVKWKKYNNNIFQTFCELESNYKIKLELLLNDLFKFFKQMCEIHVSKNKHLIDFSLESIKKIIKIKSNKEISLFLNNLDFDDFEKSSKFLLMDIIEIN